MKRGIGPSGHARAEENVSMSQRFRTIASSLLLWVSVVIGIAIARPALAGEVLRIGGTGTALGSMKLIGSEFEKSHPGIRCRVLPSMGSSGAIRAVAKGALDIGLVSRPFNGEEFRLGLSLIEYAETPFVLVTRNSIPVSGLSTSQIVKIYTGEMQAWPNGERIRLILRPATETDTFLARRVSPEMGPAVDAALSRQGMLMGLTDQDSIHMLEKTPGALGFSTLTQVVAEKRRVKVLAVNGVYPTTKALAAKVYPLAKKLYLVTKPRPSAAARRFIDFVQSAQGRKILEETGNVPASQTGGR